ncbi:hypothetical protein DVW87_07450 [Sphingomonas aracearum]|uniref:Phage holin family protein n=2 Tax=Sphingomonas aracearum TaxID=2283317 RepID=A0A369VZ67_9SPHN|nr:hypothetical protein DVW87_07450 [Sphingomonas aracearum]
MRPAEEESIGTLVLRLRDDAVEYGRAQIGVYKAEVSSRSAPAKSGAIFGVAALVLALSALVALLVGLIFTLATLIGPGGATAVVVIVTLAIAGLLGWLAARKFAVAFGGGQ